MFAAPPDTTDAIPLAVFPIATLGDAVAELPPPATTLRCPLAVLEDPPETEEKAPDAAHPSPPPTEEKAAEAFELFPIDTALAPPAEQKVPLDVAQWR